MGRSDRLHGVRGLHLTGDVNWDINTWNIYYLRQFSGQFSLSLTLFVQICYPTLIASPVSKLPLNLVFLRLYN